MRELTLEEIDDLLTSDPIIYLEQETRCASKKCGSPTYLKLKGVPYCYPHIISKVNELLREYEKNV